MLPSTIRPWPVCGGFGAGAPGTASTCTNEICAESTTTINPSTWRAHTSMPLATLSTVPLKVVSSFRVIATR
jgi:hypothetical protein